MSDTQNQAGLLTSANIYPLNILCTRMRGCQEQDSGHVARERKSSKFNDFLVKKIDQEILIKNRKNVVVLTFVLSGEAATFFALLDSEGTKRRYIPASSNRDYRVALLTRPS